MIFRLQCDVEEKYEGIRGIYGRMVFIDCCVINSVRNMREGV